MKKFLFLLPLFLLIVSCSQPEDGFVPAKILHLERTEFISGDRAAEIIDHLHQHSVTPEENYVGRYQGEGHSATYYVSVYSNTDEANAELRAMVESMERGGHVFDHVRQRSVNDRSVWMALGMGQAHYFYAEGSRLIWLAVDVPVAEDAIKSLL